MAKQVDYDSIAPSYDRRYDASRSMDKTAVVLLALAAELDAERILEVGCGTGHWLAALNPSGGQLYGLDLSPGMLGEARRREQALRLALGRAGQLPFEDGCFDLVYCVNAIHHFQRQNDFVAEARRLLRPGGVLAVIGMDPHSQPNDWYVYEFFPGTLETDLTRFPSWGTVLEWMVAAGFEPITWKPVKEIHDPKLGRKVFGDPFLRKEAVSQLALLSDQEYKAGLQRLETAIEIAETEGQSAVFQSDIYLAMLWGRTPGSLRLA